MISEILTLEKIQEAFENVKTEYDFDTGRLVLICKERYIDTFEIMGNHFTPDEPLCNAFGVKWTKDFEGLISDILQQNLSICMVSNDTDEVIGVNVLDVMKRSGPQFDPLSVKDEPLRNAFVFLHQKDKEMNLLDRYKVDEAVYCITIGVHKKFRRMGNGGRLVGAAVALSRELGFEAITAEGTSNYSQRIFEKTGFETLVELPYDSYIHKGQPIINGTGEHTMTKIYGLKL